MKFKRTTSLVLSFLLSFILFAPMASAQGDDYITKNILIYDGEVVELPDDSFYGYTSTSSTSGEFDTIYEIPSHHLVKAAQTANYIQSAIGSDSVFNFSTAQYLVNARNDLTTLSSVSKTHTRSDSNVSAMTNQVVYTLNAYLDVTMSDDVVYNLEQLIRKAYEVSYDKTNFLGLYYRKKAKKHTYRYNIFYAVDSADGNLLCLPISFTINVYIYKKKILFITIEDKKEYSCKVEAMNIKVD